MAWLRETRAGSASTSSGPELGSVEDAKVSSPTVTDVSALEDLSRDLRNDPEARAAFLATFSAEEEKAIMRKVDKRFLILIGFMFMVKNASYPTHLAYIRQQLTRRGQIDYGNISIIKTMHIGTPSNIMTELGFTADGYNWVATTQGVSPPRLVGLLLVC